MNAPSKDLFPVITDAHWRAMFARHRAEVAAGPTPIALQILDNIGPIPEHVAEFNRMREYSLAEIARAFHVPAYLIDGEQSKGAPCP